MVWYGIYRERQNGSCPMKRGRSEKTKVVRNKQADVGGLLATWCYGQVWSWVTPKEHVWVSGPAVAMVCVDVHISC